MFRYLQDVATLEYNADQCVGCGRCGEVCPHGVFTAKDGSSLFQAEIVDRDLCMECGACARNCPVEAITVRAGVGCAQGIIRGALGIGGDCCCGPDSEGSTCGDASEADSSSCCG
jgi:NAD-dependent dihydropyrimidine dehydrogenase PreA subunit